MKNVRTIALCFFLIFGSVWAQGQDGIDIPPQITQVLDYLDAKEPPLANGQPYKVRVVSWKIYDIDGNGTDEIFLQTVPRFLQSPTVSIFQLDKKGGVIKMLEGFAPGKLLALQPEDRLEDPHTQGRALDMPLDQKQPKLYKALADSSFKFSRNVVLYRTYAHTDSRKGPHSFIDLTYLETSRKACGGFAFAQPEQIAVGKMAGRKNNVFVAKVDDRLYVYEIRGFTHRGFVDKTVTLLELPEDFLQLETENDQIRYRTKNDKLKTLKG